MYYKGVLDRRFLATQRSLSRDEFLKMGGASLVGLALLGVAAPAFANGETVTSASDLGISPKNTAEQNRENLVKALWNSNRSVNFPPGDYLLNNDGSLYVSKFSGKLKMEPGARFIFTRDASRGMTFADSVGARFEGLTVTYQTLPSERNSEHSGMVFERGEDIEILDVDINGSGAVGLGIVNSVRPKIDGAVIRNTMADGLYIHNCKDSRVNDLLTENTGDDGLAIHNFSHDPDFTGAHATNITVKNSRSRGIAIGGQRDVTVDGFTVDGTACSGVICYYDDHYKTRVPSNVVLSNGSIYDAGKMPEAPDYPKYGLQYYAVESLECRNIKVISPKQRGVSGEQRGHNGIAPSGTVRLSNIEVQDAPSHGFSLVGGSSSSRLVGGKHYLDNLTVKGSSQCGIYVGYNELVEYGSLTSINASKTDDLRRAFSLEHNNRVDGEELRVVDDQKTPTGYKVATYGRQTGSLGAIRDQVANGKAQVENLSGLAVGEPGEYSIEPSPSKPVSPRRKRQRKPARQRKSRGRFR